MKYFFILGRNPELSLLEICALMRSEGYALSESMATPHAFITRISPEPSLPILMARLGGTIKIGTLIQEDSFLLEESSLLISLEKFLSAVHGQKSERVTFGFSAYTISQNKKKEKSIASFLFRLGLSLKKHLKEKGYACRLVPCQKNQLFLSSVSVAKNHLLPPHGIEYVLLEYTNSYLLGCTQSVQPFEEYSFRDWNRPQKNMEVGILPPKLAQIMLNLSECSPSRHSIILDPFCGFGTIVQEAILMGFSSAQGSDINPKMVLAAQKNLSWLAEKKQLSIPKNCIRKADATHLTKIFRAHSFDALVTEPYLSPVIHSHEHISRLAIQKISRLYINFLQEAFSLLKNTGALVLALPVWLQKDTKIFLPIIDDMFSKIGFTNATLPSDCARFIQRTTPRKTLLYARPGQSVGREIVVLKKSYTENLNTATSPSFIL